MFFAGFKIARLRFPYNDPEAPGALIGVLAASISTDRAGRARLVEGMAIMKLRILTLAALAVILCGSLTASAREKSVYWTAASSNSTAITSDIEISSSKLTIGYIDFPISKVQDVTPAEALAVFDVDTGVRGVGALYHLNIVASTRFQHNNTLCGGEDTQWMLSWTTQHSLKIAFFSGAEKPTLTFEAINNSPQLCGVFSYAH